MSPGATVGVLDGAPRPVEPVRLLAGGRRHRMASELLFDRVGVEPGWQALDLGCGSLGVLDVLAERVGPRGCVIGLDPDPTLLAAARDALVARGVSGVRLVRGDLTETGGATGSFDLAHARLVLGDLPDPQQTVAEMARLVRAGGWVALQDADVASWACEPGSGAWDDLAAVLVRTWPGDPGIGRRLPELLRCAGLAGVEVDVHSRIWSDGDPRRLLLPQLVARNRRRILADGALTAAELDRALGAVTEHLARPDTLVVAWTLFQAWARKPA